MPPAKSRSKTAHRYEPTKEINQKFPKPPRYYLGFFLSGNERILFDDAIFYQMEENLCHIINRDPMAPFDGEVEVDQLSYTQLERGDKIEIDEIQYAIGILAGDGKYVYRVFNHESENTPALLYIDKQDRLVLKAEMELDDSKAVMGIESPYQVTQFIN